MPKKLTPKPCPGGCGDSRPRRVDELCLRCRRDLLEGREERARREREVAGAFEIEGERAYPIWSIQSWWLEDIVEGAKPTPGMLEDAPAGRFWNASQHYEMFRDELKPGMVARRSSLALRKSLASEKRAAGHASDPLVTTRFVRRETWCLGWFSHYTFDAGQSDAEALASFSRYVERMERLNERESGAEGGLTTPAVVLMGAEERGRWTALGDDESKEAGDPPCRCASCKKQGLIRIDH